MTLLNKKKTFILFKSDFLNLNRFFICMKTLGHFCNKIMIFLLKSDFFY